MKLSQNFTLEEFTLSQTASRLGLNNDPSPQVLENLKITAKGLEEVRALLKKSIRISSGFRSEAVNKEVGGSTKSQHLLGQAADFTSPQFGTPRQIVQAIVNSNIKYDQVILEFDSWCHISFTDTPRKQALIIDKSGVRPFI